MKKFEGILFCTDLDGTLYTTDKKVSEQNASAIEYFKSEGGVFTFITGRAASTSEEIYRTIKPNAPFGCFNGGGIYDRQKRQLVWSVPLDESVLELVDYVYKGMPDVSIEFNTEDIAYQVNMNKAMDYRLKILGLEENHRDYNGFNEKIYKVVFAHHDKARLLELADFLKKHPKSDKFDFINSASILCEIMPKGVGKGTALYQMAEILGIDKNRTIAVGDYNNDISMVECAKAGFAVANAVEELKVVADYITVCNDDHAIATIIDGLDRGIFKV